jgi:threonine/homoserine/homoserine lactone efflux protein
MIVHLPAFVGIAALVIVTPGPDTALTVRNTLAGGRRGGIATAWGVVAGQATWSLATAAGVTALLIASQGAFVALQLLGAGYLVWLGLTGLWRMLSNLGNPKMAAFFPSLLPQFARGTHSFATLLLLGLGFCAMTLAWLTLYAVVLARLGPRMERSRVRRAIDGLAGAALVALGVRLATERR